MPFLTCISGVKGFHPQENLSTKQQNCHCIMESLETQSHKHKCRLFLQPAYKSQQRRKWKTFRLFHQQYHLYNGDFPQLFSYDLLTICTTKYLPRSNRLIGSILLKESKKHKRSPGNSLDLNHHPLLLTMNKICLLQNQRKTTFTGWTSWLFSNHRSLSRV